MEKIGTWTSETRDGESKLKSGVCVHMDVRRMRIIVCKSAQLDEGLVIAKGSMHVFKSDLQLSKTSSRIGVV